MIWLGQHGEERFRVRNKKEMNRKFIELSKGRATVCLDEDVSRYVTENKKIFSKMGLIGRFRVFWPNLGDLDKYIAQFWSPILEGDVQIYFRDREFSMVVFNNDKYTKKVLCDY